MTLASSSGKKPILSGFGQFLAFFAGLCALIGSLAVSFNDAYYLSHAGPTPSVVLFLIAFAFGFLPSAWGLALVLVLLPLTAGIPGLAKAAYAGLIQQALDLGFLQVQASMQPQNLAAIRLVRQCGMQLLTAGPAEVRYQICRADAQRDSG